MTISKYVPLLAVAAGVYFAPQIALPALCVYGALKLMPCKRARYGFDKTIEKTPYSLDKAIEQVKVLSQDPKKKLCLFIGRSPGEPFPGVDQEKPDDEIWVSLDCQNNPKFSHRQLHLQIDMREAAEMERIRGLFEKVLVDFSTFKFVPGESPEERLAFLRRLITPAQTSQIIAEANSSSMITIEKLKPYLPKELQHFDFGRIIMSHNTEYQEAVARMKEAEAESLRDKIARNFRTVQLNTGHIPFMYRKGPHKIHYMICQGPLNPS